MTRLWFVSKIGLASNTNKYCQFIATPRVALYTVGQLGTPPSDVNSHSRAHLPDCVMKVAAWLGFACVVFFYRYELQQICTLTPNLSKHILFECIKFVLAFQKECNLWENLNFAAPNNIAGLYTIHRAVCFQHDCVQFRRAVRLIHCHWIREHRFHQRCAQ